MSEEEKEYNKAKVVYKEAAESFDQAYKKNNFAREAYDRTYEASVEAYKVYQVADLAYNKAREVYYDKVEKHAKLNLMNMNEALNKLNKGEF